MSEKKSKIAKLFEDSNPNVDEIYEKVLKKKNYCRQQMELDLVHLKQWLKNQHHLPVCRLQETDNFLSNYLTRYKGSLETVKQKLDDYYSLRGKSEVYSKRDPLDEHYRKICDTNPTAVLPRFTENGECIMVSKCSKSDVHPSFLINSMKRTINIIEVMLREVGPINLSSITLIDFENHTTAHAMLQTPEIFRHSLHLFQNVFPSKISSIILYNVPPLVEVLVNTMVKPSLLTKLRDRFIVIAGGIEELHKHIDKSLLPKDWQGNLPFTLQEINDMWNEYEITHRDWFVNELSQQTDETKRIYVDAENFGQDSQFGVQGTLKKLARN